LDGTSVDAGGGLVKDGNYWTSTRAYRMTRRRLLQSGAIAGAGVGVLALACGTKPSSKSGSSGSSSGGKPQTGGKFTLAVTTDPVDWDVSYTGKTPPAPMGLSEVYESLLGFQRGPNVPYGQLKVEPELAASYESPDAQTYTFHLRPGSTWANLPPVNGRPVTSDDIKFSFEYSSRTGAVASKKLPQAQFDWYFEGMQSIQTPDPQTVVVKFAEPFAPFLNYAAADYNVIMPHEIYDKDGSFKDSLVGTGPFQLDVASTQKGSKYVFKRNPTYHEKGLPYIDEIDWLVIPDSSAEVAAFQANRTDYLSGSVITTPQVAALQKAVPTAKLFSDLAVSPFNIYLNQRPGTGPLADMRVRQAIGLGIDRDEFINSIEGGQGGWAMAGAFADTWTQAEIKQILKFDPQAAKQLLSAAGYSNGVELEFTYPGSQFGDKSIQQYQLLQAQLKKIGVNLNLKSLDPTAYSQNNKTAKFTMNARGKDVSGDVDSYLYATYFSTSKANYNGCNDPKLDALILAQRHEPDPTKRRDAVRAASKYLNETAQGMAVNFGMNFEFISARVQNYAPQFEVDDVPGADTWLKQS
jgi:peptide/nickel transport system substrate-binding protein